MSGSKMGSLLVLLGESEGRNKWVKNRDSLGVPFG